MNLPQLRKLLVLHFDDDELRDLCFEIGGIDYQNLRGEGINLKAMELIEYARRHSRIPDLLSTGRRIRPDVPWPDSVDLDISLDQPPRQPLTLEQEKKTPPTSIDNIASSSNQVQQVTLEFKLTRKGARITWKSDGMDNINTTFLIPYNFKPEALPLVIKALNSTHYATHSLDESRFSREEQEILTEMKLWKNNRLDPSISKTVGETIYNALGLGGINALKEIQKRANAKRAIINYILRFPEEAMKLALLPWELMYDKEFLLFQGQGSSLTRYIDLDEPLPKVPTKEEKPHLIALLPIHDVPTDIYDIERNARLSIWNKLRDQDSITFSEIHPLTQRALTKHLSGIDPKRPIIIHYFGYGTYRDGNGHLLFDNDNGTSQSMVSIEQLTARLPNTPLFVIQACQSATMAEEGSMLTGIVPALCTDNSAVVAMQLSMNISAAIRFNEIFYESLLVKRRPLQEAVAEGRKTLFFEFELLTNWYVPTLYIRSRDQGPFNLIEP